MEAVTWEKPKGDSRLGAHHDLKHPGRDPGSSPAVTAPEDQEPDEFAPADSLEPDERDIEAPTADAAEQATTADPADEPAEEPLQIIQRGLALEVDEYDALEQARVVTDDEE